MRWDAAGRGNTGWNEVGRDAMGCNGMTWDDMGIEQFCTDVSDMEWDAVHVVVWCGKRWDRMMSALLCVYV